MDVLHKGRWLAVSLVLLLPTALIATVEIYNAYPSYMVSTLIIIACGVALLRWCSVFSFRAMSYVIIFTPALAPAYMHLRGRSLFSLAAVHLQTNPALIDKAVFLFCAAAVVYVLIAIQSHLEPKKQEKPSVLAVVDINGVHLYFIAIMTIVCAFVIDSGPTIITANYDEVLAGRLHSTPLIVLLNVLFGCFWGMLFVHGRQNKRLFWIVTIIVFMWFFLHVRRVEAFGMVFVLVLWQQYSLKRATLAVLLVLFIFAQAKVGVSRNRPISMIGISASKVEMYEEKEIRRAKMSGRKAAIPGGASNVFLSYLHLVNEKDSDALSDDQKLTMLQWPRSIIPNTLWKMIGMPPTKSEHESIYDALELEYVGGMHLLGVFYLNGGVWLVVFYGLLHGALARGVDYLTKMHFHHNFSYGGKISLFPVTVFLVYQFRYHWYNPQTLFRALAYSVVVFLFISAVSRWSSKKRYCNEDSS